MTEDRGDDRKVPSAVRFTRVVWRERPYSGGPPAHLQHSLVVDHTEHHDERAGAPPRRGEVDSDEGHPYMVNRRHKERRGAQGTVRASRLPCGV